MAFDSSKFEMRIDDLVDVDVFKMFAPIEVKSCRYIIRFPADQLREGELEASRVALRDQTEVTVRMQSTMPRFWFIVRGRIKAIVIGSRVRIDVEGTVVSSQNDHS